MSLPCESYTELVIPVLNELNYLGFMRKLFMENPIMSRFSSPQ